VGRVRILGSADLEGEDVIYLVPRYHFDGIAWMEIHEDPKPPGPVIPPEVHNNRPVDPQRAMDAVRAMCGESNGTQRN